MCGISGLANCGDRQTLARMTSVQAHRGPDDFGLWEQRFPDGSYIALGSRRLAILDLSPDGHMPMCNQDRTCGSPTTAKSTTSPNCAGSCEARDTSFVSDTDTEVVLHLYEELRPRLRKTAERNVCFCHLRSALWLDLPVRCSRSFWSKAVSTTRNTATDLPSPRKSRRCCKCPASTLNSIRKPCISI